MYGSTEVPVTTVGCASDDADHAADTDGRPGIAEIKLVDGEICARGPQMLVGYLHPEDEPASFDDEGYFRTGDLGRWVDDGYLVVTGRAKDIIIRNGENISPKEVEDLLIGASRHRRDRGRRPARRAHRRTGLRGHRARRSTRGPTSRACVRS